MYTHRIDVHHVEDHSDHQKLVLPELRHDGNRREIMNVCLHEKGDVASWTRRSTSMSMSRRRNGLPRVTSRFGNIRPVLRKPSYVIRNCSNFSTLPLYPAMCQFMHSSLSIRRVLYQKSASIARLSKSQPILLLNVEVCALPQTLDNQLLALCASVDVLDVICILLAHAQSYPWRSNLPVVVSKWLVAS